VPRHSCCAGLDAGSAGWPGGGSRFSSQGHSAHGRGSCCACLLLSARDKRRSVRLTVNLAASACKLSYTDGQAQKDMEVTMMRRVSQREFLSSTAILIGTGIVLASCQQAAPTSASVTPRCQPAPPPLRSKLGWLPLRRPLRPRKRLRPQFRSRACRKRKSST